MCGINIMNVWKEEDAQKNKARDTSEFKQYTLLQNIFLGLIDST